MSSAARLIRSRRKISRAADAKIVAAADVLSSRGS
jgi:hypothetical protein